MADMVHECGRRLILDSHAFHHRPFIVAAGEVGLRAVAGARQALATALFRDGHLSLARSARVARIPLPAFITHLSRLGIAVVRLTEAETVRDLDTLDQWLASS